MDRINETAQAFVTLAVGMLISACAFALVCWSLVELGIVEREQAPEQVESVDLLPPYWRNENEEPSPIVYDLRSGFPVASPAPGL